MAELVDAADSTSTSSNTVRVQVPLRPPENKSAGLTFFGTSLALIATVFVFAKCVFP